MSGAPIAVLQRVPLFADLDESELERIASVFKERRFSKGDTVIQQGSGAAAFFVIDSGEVTRARGRDRAQDPEGRRLLRRDGADRRGHAHGDREGLDRPRLLRRHVLGLPPIVEENGVIGWKLLQSLIEIYRSERFG